MGLTRCYKTKVFLHLYAITVTSFANVVAILWGNWIVHPLGSRNLLRTLVDS